VSSWKGYEVVQDALDCRTCILNETVQYYEKHCPIDLSKDYALSMKIQTKQKQRIDLFRTEVKELREAKVITADYNPFILILLGVVAIVLVVGMVTLWLKIKAYTDTKINTKIDKHLEAWIKNHVIKEEADYLNNEFNLKITREGETHNGKQQ